MTDEEKTPRLAGMSPERYAAILSRQERDWPKQRQGAAQGNPFATLCQHCCGRHPPPNDEICPHESIEQLKARTP